VNATPRTLIVVATYNEIENLPRLVHQILTVAPDVDILVIDDNSPDGTGSWCDHHAKQEPRLRCLHRPKKLGLGTATLAGFRDAFEHGYDFVLTMDADFSHNPSYIPAMRDRMAVTRSASDVVIGSRYVPGGGVEGWPLHRRLMSRLVNTYARMLLGLSVKDCSGAFRCYRCETLKEVNFENVRSKGYSYLEEILWLLKRRQARFDEVPIVFVDRVMGQTKINWREAVNAIFIIGGLGARNLLGM